jgi:vancomycin resistance protein YoaR
MPPKKIIPFTVPNKPLEKRGRKGAQLNTRLVELMNEEPVAKPSKGGAKKITTEHKSEDDDELDVSSEIINLNGTPDKVISDMLKLKLDEMKAEIAILSKSGSNDSEAIRKQIKEEMKEEMKELKAMMKTLKETHKAEIKQAKINTANDMRSNFSSHGLI